MNRSLFLALSVSMFTGTAASADEPENKKPPLVQRHRLAHEDAVLFVAFSPSGKTLATGGGDKMVHLWDVSDGRHIAALEGHERPVTSGCFSPDGKTLATGSIDESVRLWDVDAVKPRSKWRQHEGWVTGVAFNPKDENMLASASRDGTVRLWDVAARKTAATLFTGGLGLTSVAFSADGKLIAAGRGDAAANLWTVSTRQPAAADISAQEGAVNCVAFRPDGKALATGGSPDWFTFWNTDFDPKPGEPLRHGQNFELQSTLRRRTEGAVTSMAFSCDGKLFVVGESKRSDFGDFGKNGWVSLWKVGNPQLLGSLSHGGLPVMGVAFSPDGKLVASASEDHTAIIWDVASASSTPGANKDVKKTPARDPEKGCR